MAETLFKDAEPFGQTVNIPLVELPMRNLVQISQLVSGDKSFEDYTVLHRYIAQVQGQIIPREQICIVTTSLEVLLLKSYIVRFNHSL